MLDQNYTIDKRLGNTGLLFHHCKGTLVLICLLISCTFSLYPQAQKNTTLVGALPYDVELNDIWGYVDSSGREYALVGLTNAVSIVDLSDPTQPTELHRIPGAETVWRDLKTFQDFAYVSNEGDSGLLIIDLSGLPSSISYKDTVMAGVITAHNIWIDEFGFLYMVGCNVFSGGAAIFDLNTDPWNPGFVGFYDERYVHDVYVRDNKAYLAEIFDGQLTILDVSDKSDPQVLGVQAYLNGFTHNTWLNDAGTVCFTTDEFSGASVIAWDVTDPSNIQRLDEIQSSLSNGGAAPHNVHVLNDFLITSYYRDGVHITDASRPDNLVEVGYYDSSPLEGGGFAGDWGAYPFLPSGLILVSDIEEGLFVIQPTYQRGCYLEGIVGDSETSMPLSGVEIVLGDSLSLAMSELDGFYATGVADSGMYDIEYSKYGYFPTTVSITLDNGQLSILDLTLIPSPRVDYQIEVLESGTLSPIEGAEVRSEVIGEDEVFTFQTDLDGLISQSRFVIDQYKMTVGKWGYITQEMIVTADSANPSITFLLEPGFYDDFALDFGWTVEGDARNGMWERGEPIGTYETFFNWGIFNPEFDLADDIGDQAYVTGNRGGSAFAYDVDRGFTQLVSPPIDLTLYDHPRITFSYWLVNWSLKNSGQPGNDFLRVSLTDGIDTFAVRQYIGPFDTTWTQAEIRVEQYFPPDRDIQVMFYTQDFEAGNQDAVEAGIDGFQVLEGYPLSIDRPREKVDLAVSTLPGQDRLQVRIALPDSFLGQAMELDIFSITGQLITTLAIDPGLNHQLFPFSHSAGLYVGRLRSGAQILATKRFVYSK